MAQATEYRARVTFQFDTLDPALTRMLDLARTTGWREIELTSPTAKTFRVLISQDFAVLDNARSWIKSMAALGNFENASITQK
jgi:hypothetical protein